MATGLNICLEYAIKRAQKHKERLQMNGSLQPPFTITAFFLGENTQSAKKHNEALSVDRKQICLT
jgi:hypothetical protein